jgi:pimeloyl-ACP methyl ester carboxylesterase
MTAHILYLHGFASSVRTAKGLALGARLAADAASYGIPDLEGGDFRALTMDGILARAAAAIDALPEDGRAVLLIGSSLGGYTAARLAALGATRPLAGALLIAPAFRFPSSWAARLGEAAIAQWRRDGERAFFHHAHERELPLGYGFLESCRDLPDLPAQARCPVAIVHGLEDASVDWQGSAAYAGGRARVELHLVAGDHRLGEARHEELMAWCARDLLARAAAPA